MAVYTDISDEDLRDFIAAYSLGALESFTGIAEGVENSNFLIRTERGPSILTLYEKRVDPTDLPFFLGLMEHLAARGVPCPTPLKTRDGRTLRRLAGRPAAMVSFLPGVWPRRPTAAHCQGVGAALAKLHHAADGFALSRVNALALDGWRPLAAQTAGGADRVHHGLAAAISEELEALTVSWPQDLPVGIIHADLFPDNVFFQGETLSGVIDFYFACRDFLAYDLAICLNAWCFDPDGRQMDVTRARALFAGYQSVRPLTPAERAAFPLLCRGAAMRFLLTRLYDWLNQIPGALVIPKNPLDYLHRLRFHQGASDLAAYGLS